ncbi:hypothetical protein ABIF03_003609 [Bradyrhizobium elkanii]
MPSPMNWLGRPAGLQHRLRHRAEEAVDDEHGVERQPLLGKLRRAAHVDEHADQIALLADPCRIGGVRVGRCRARQEQLEEIQVGGGPQLAGQPDRRIVIADPVQHEGFARRGLGQSGVIADDADAAGRAARAAAADARMRHVVAQARFQHAQSLRHPERAAVAVGQCNHAAAAFQQRQRTRAARQQHKAEQAEIADRQVIRDLLERGPLRRGAELLYRELLAPPVGVLIVGDRGAAALIDAEHRQRRDQHGRREQERRGALEERAQPQPEIQADAAVHPGDHQHRQHRPQPVRRCDEEGV